MDDQHRRLRRVLLETRAQLEALEAASSNPALPADASAGIHAAFRANLALLSSGVASLRLALPRAEAAAAQAGRVGVWRARVGALEDEVRELGGADGRIGARLGAAAGAARMREDLLRRRGAPVGEGQGGDVVLGMGDAGQAAEEGKRLEAGGRGIGEVVGVGRGALAELAGQRVRLKGARRKVLDVVSTIEAGIRLIGKIEETDRRDTVVMYGCMAGILALLLAATVWKYHRKGVL